MSTDNQTTSKTTSYLITLGEEFEKFSGMRPFAIADDMHEEDPIDDLWLYVDSCQLGLDEQTATEGVATVDELYPLAKACFHLREKYGHEVWIGKALHQYLRRIKGQDEGVAALMRDSMLGVARARYEAMRAKITHEADVADARQTVATLAGIDAAAEDMKRRLESLRKAMNVLNLEMAA